MKIKSFKKKDNINKILNNNFFYNSDFIQDFININIKNGNKEKTEKQLLDVFKKIDYYLFFEVLNLLKFSFKFYSKRKRTGRHSYISKDRLIHIDFDTQYKKAIFNFKKLLIDFNSNTKKKKYFYKKDLINFFKSFISNKGKYPKKMIINYSKKALFLKGIQHFRWNKKKQKKTKKKIKINAGNIV